MHIVIFKDSFSQSNFFFKVSNIFSTHKMPGFLISNSYLLIIKCIRFTKKGKLY